MSSSRNQPSRKGKKAWRKNVDVSDVQQLLDDARDREILHGDEADFVIDTTGNALKSGAKKLKSLDILTNKSKVPALLLERNVRKPVSRKNVTRLMKLAGRIEPSRTLQTRAEIDGIVRGGNKDVWGTEEPLTVPEVLQKRSSIAYTKATVAPKTMAQKPVKLSLKRKNDEVVDAGKSYNPSLELWQSLIDKEFRYESAEEAKRQELVAKQERIQALIANLDDNEEASDDDDEEGEDAAAPGDYGLSINAPTKNKKKNKTKRNKEARHKERMALQDQLSELKAQIRELSKLDQYNKEVDQKLANTKTRKRRVTKLGKHEITDRPLEVKLSDELNSNLKNVKPEGNLFYDQMIKLQEDGRIEPRVPVEPSRTYGTKIADKYVYKFG